MSNHTDVVHWLYCLYVGLCNFFFTFAFLPVDIAVLTVNNTESDIGNITLIPHNGTNYVNSASQRWHCDNSLFNTTCLYLRIFNSQCGSIERITITYSGVMDKDETDSDPYTVFAVKNSGGTYDAITVLADWDGGVKIITGASSQTGGVFVSPNRDSTSLIKIQDIFTVWDFEKVGKMENTFDNRQPLSYLNDTSNWALLTSTALNDEGADPITLTITNNVANNSAMIEFNHTKTGVVNCTFNAALDTFNSGNDLLVFFMTDQHDAEYQAFAIQTECISPSMPPPATPSEPPSSYPTASPTTPTTMPSAHPSNTPSIFPTNSPSQPPTGAPTYMPSDTPTNAPSVIPSTSPSNSPSISPTNTPSIPPTSAPTGMPTHNPTVAPSTVPSITPSMSPSVFPSAVPSGVPSMMPSAAPSGSPTLNPTDPTFSPTKMPTNLPTDYPTFAPKYCSDYKTNWKEWNFVNKEETSIYLPNEDEIWVDVVDSELNDNSTGWVVEIETVYSMNPKYLDEIGGKTRWFEVNVNGDFSTDGINWGIDNVNPVFVITDQNSFIALKIDGMFVCTIFSRLFHKTHARLQIWDVWRAVDLFFCCTVKSQVGFGVL